MKRGVFWVFWLTCLAVWGQPEDYVWTSMSRNAAGSMPCGGGDVGMNVWVEQGDVLLYMSRSGSFDENNTLLKQGRWRIRLGEPLQETTFRQALLLRDGYVSISDGRQRISIWADVEKPVVHVEMECSTKTTASVTYESWRTQERVIGPRERFQTSYKFAAPKGLTTLPDSISATPVGLTFVHRNREQTIFDATVAQQRMDAVKHRLYNPLRRLTFGGRMQGRGFTLAGRTEGRYASTPYVGWRYEAPAARRHHVQIALATVQGSMEEWTEQLQKTEQAVRLERDRRATRLWWHQFWQRSFIATPGPQQGEAASLLRNYTLFRYMLGCNARGAWPTKFNGGLFTFDPEYVNQAEEYQLTPDFRNWGGGVHTAQNQRLVYWPLLKSGDLDLLRPQLDFYLRIYRNAEERSRLYWGHGGACLTEQVENYGLPCYPEYGTRRPEGFDPGMERNAWLEYEWDTALEFCQMALLARRYGDVDTAPYVPLVCSVLDFFDLHYQYLAQQRGAKTLDGQGHLVIFPGSGGETFKMAYNPSSTVAGLRTVTQELLTWLKAQADTALVEKYEGLLARLPQIPLKDGMIAPAEVWARVQNVETTQLYPVFPWRVYGVGRPGLDVARRTYQADTLAVKFRSHVGWKQDHIWAACLGLTDEARRLALLKLADGPHRFPAFWGPGFDWTPDHNWGGSAMTGLQEMLLQEVPDPDHPDGPSRLLLFPAWPREWDVHFRLHASGHTTVEATLQGGRLTQLHVTPEDRKVVVMLEED